MYSLLRTGGTCGVCRRMSVRRTSSPPIPYVVQAYERSRYVHPLRSDPGSWLPGTGYCHCSALQGPWDCRPSAARYAASHQSVSRAKLHHTQAFAKRKDALLRPW
jgi:hypothetical protein